MQPALGDPPSWVKGMNVYCVVLLQQSKYKVINRDQWCNVLEFSRSINPDLSNYDEDGACKCGKEDKMWPS